MSQRDASPAGGGHSDGIQSKNIRISNKSIENYDEDHNEESSCNRIGANHPPIQESNHLHRNICESPLEQIIGSIRQSHTRSNHSPIFSTDSTYSSERLVLSDLTDSNTINAVGQIDSMNSSKSRLQYQQNHQNNIYCQQQRAVLSANDPPSYLHQPQHVVNEMDTSNIDNRINYHHCTFNDQQQRHTNKHINDDRSTSPTSSSDIDHSSSRYSRKNRQHSSHRHRHINLNNDSNIYQSTMNHVQIAKQHSPINKQHSSNVCHRYHEIEEPTSCSPMCDSGMRGDDDYSSSSAPSNNRDHLSNCEDMSDTMCSLMVTATTTTSTTMPSSNVLSSLPIVAVSNYHHRGSSGISCESSTSSSIVRNHGPIENCMPVERHLNISRHNHVIQPYALDHSQRIQNVHARETKSPLFIGFDAIQISSTPSKNKCQCHIDHLPQQQVQLHQQQQQHQHQQQQAQNGHHHHHHHYHQHQQYGNQDKRIPEGDNEDINLTAINSRMHQPPALPPRPPPRPNRRYETSAYNSRADSSEGVCCKKYVVLCCLCGGLSAAVGSLFLAVHAVLSAHTASLALFETVPSYIPGAMLILMGLFTMLLARRKHRYGILMKVCGSVGVVCALVCVLVTVTTTVVHMSRLQGLRECVYTARARSCTCYGTPQGHSGDPGILFEGMPHCEAVHGTLYACLRALFGVSVAGILACIFSCMLVYQLLSHEKKKMYWEQLELRCRSLYGHGGGVPVSGVPTGSCGCCNDCGGVNPWWAQTPGNLYTPNPDLAPSRRWRLPWSRSRGPAPTPDSNYGFHAQSMRHATDVSDPTRESTTTVPTPYGLIDTHQTNTPYSVLNPQTVTYTPSNASYSVLETPVPLWGPPPPYSDPNSPARRPQIVEPKISSSACSTASSTPATSASPAQLPPPPPARIVNIKRALDNYDPGDDHHSQRVLQHCPNSDNYENTDEVSNNTDPECSNAGNIGHEITTLKGSRRSRRALRGVENDGFQKETAHQIAMNKQSESELYFGDVSSCCGPESSLYELTVDKELASTVDDIQHQQQQQHQQDYVSPRIAKQRLSKRSRKPLPLPPQPQSSPHQDTSIDLINERSYSNGDEQINSSTAFLAPDAQYEIIQQSARYGGYYSGKTDDFREVTPSSYSFYSRDVTDVESSARDYRIISNDDDNERNTSSTLNAPVMSADDVDLTHEKIPIKRNEQHQCCQTNINHNANDINNDWQNVEQQSDDGICPINV